MSQHQSNFYWAAGIENTFIPQTRPGLRALEEYELTQHYDLWRDDLAQVASLGISHLRWGVPWYRVQPEPDRWDWKWVDEVLDTMVNTHGIQPILDLMHYGTPLWLENSFINASYPNYVGEYAQAFVERYRDLVQFYTPLNEPTVNAHFSGRIANWPPYLEGEDGYVKVLMQIVRGMGLTIQAIQTARPDAIFVQVEALGWSWTNNEALDECVKRDRDQEFLAFDLLLGRVDDQHSLFGYLQNNGVATEDLHELRNFMSSQTIKLSDNSLILGVNLYPWSGGEWIIDTDGNASRKGALTGHQLADVLRYSWKRYQIPMMITETSAARDMDGRALWMDNTIAAVRSAQAEGIPIAGYTWFPAFTMIDWEYRNRTDSIEKYLLHLGLWDSAFDSEGVLQRQPTQLVERYQKYIRGEQI